MRFSSLAVVCLGLASFYPARQVAAQQRGKELLVTPDGVRLDFPANGVWRARARRVAEARRQLLAARQFDQLNAVAERPAVRAGAQFVPPGPVAMTGTLNLPTILIAFSNTDTTVRSKAIKYDSLFYTAQSLTGRPYTLRTFYEEMSNNAMTITGTTYGWMPVSNDSSYYYDACKPQSNNGIACTTGRTHLREAIVQALTALDGAVNFGQYDSDGPDGVPNSNDDDGLVDLVQVLHPALGSECSGPGYNAHRFGLSGLGGTFSTNDVSNAPGGGVVRVDAYTLISAVGGAQCSNASQIAGIGTFAHELGHGLGLPDLYDTNPSDSDGDTEGIGEWGLMGSGNYTSLISPAHFDAWSKQQMGWVTVRQLNTSNPYTVGPVVSLAVGKPDTVFLINPTGSNPRNEYFLVENKQAVGSDAANMTGGSRPKGGGLLIWHLDQQRIDEGSLVGIFANLTNTGPIHGVSLIQADGLRQLDIPNGNRGNAGDPFPGTTGNTSFSFATNPAATKNSDGSFAGFQITGITQQSLNGPMAFNLTFGGPTVVQANDTFALVKVDGVAYNRFAQLVANGANLQLDMDSPQTTADNRRQFTFSSWSDGQPRSHTIIGTLAGTTYTAQVASKYKVSAATSGAGSVASNPVIDLANGAFVDQGSSLTVTATASGGALFDRWSGDTSTSTNPLTFPVNRPYNLVAVFAAPLSVSSSPPPGPVMGKAYTFTFTAAGGNGTVTWLLATGALPSGLQLTAAGILNGTPGQAGTFPVTVRATSGAQTADVSIAVTVTEPQLTVANVMAHILATGTTLSIDDIGYLDLVGNRNGTYDVGDFLAWVNRTNAVPPAAVMELLMAGSESGPPEIRVQRVQP